MEEAELDRLAREELLLEAKRGAERAKDMGTTGWLKPKVPNTNKRFLQNTIRSALFSSKQTDLKTSKAKHTHSYSRYNDRTSSSSRRDISHIEDSDSRTDSERKCTKYDCDNEKCRTNSQKRHKLREDLKRDEVVERTEEKAIIRNDSRKRKNDTSEHYQSREESREGTKRQKDTSYHEAQKNRYGDKRRKNKSDKDF